MGAALRVILIAGVAAVLVGVPFLESRAEYAHHKRLRKSIPESFTAVANSRPRAFATPSLASASTPSSIARMKFPARTSSPIPVSLSPSGTGRRSASRPFAATLESNTFTSRRTCAPTDPTPPLARK